VASRWARSQGSGVSLVSLTPITSISGGGLGLTADGWLIRPHQEFTVTALVPNPEPNQKVRIHLPESGGFSLVPGQEEERMMNKGSSQVSWKVRAGEAGSYHFVVTSGLTRGDLDLSVRNPSGFR
jgi:hypothetical protein